MASSSSQELDVPKPLLSPRQVLRVGVVLDSLEVRAWQHALLKRICVSPYVRLVLTVLSHSESRRSAADSARVLTGVYGFIDRKLRCRPDALAKVDAAALVRGIPRLDLRSTARRGAGDLQRHRLDALVDLGGEELPGEWKMSVRWGIWTVAFGDAAHGFGNPPGFWEVRLGRTLTESRVRIALWQAGRPVDLCSRSVSRTQPFSFSETNNKVYWKMASVLPRRLEALQRLGDQHFQEWLERQSAEAAPTGGQPRPVPGLAMIAQHIARTTARQLVNFAIRAITRRPWIVLYHFGVGISTRPDRFCRLAAPRNRYWADPFIIARDDQFYVFLEEVPNATGKGHISLLVMDREGRHQGSQTVLERDYHLSYPFVFEHDGAWYMVPESSANRTVELYKCSEFPARWEFVENLLADICAADATLLRHDGKWWLFANVVENRGASSWEDLFLFHSDALIGGAWKSHPLNPVVSDVRSSRPAGAIFEDHGRLFRPAQDSSVRYGYGIKINEITVLSENDYAEKEVKSIVPSWDQSLVATHTLNHAGGMTVIDAMQPRSRL